MPLIYHLLGEPASISTTIDFFFQRVPDLEPAGWLMSRDDGGTPVSRKGSKHKKASWNWTPWRNHNSSTMNQVHSLFLMCKMRNVTDIFLKLGYHDCTICYHVLIMILIMIWVFPKIMVKPPNHPY